MISLTFVSRRPIVAPTRELTEAFNAAMDEPASMEQALLSFRRTIAARFDGMPATFRPAEGGNT